MHIKINELPSIEYLNECFLYDEENGVLVWKKRPLHHFVSHKGYKTWNGKWANKKAGKLVKSHKNGPSCECVTLSKTAYRTHRLIFKMIHGYEPLFIDHINGNPLDNKISNLRSVTQKENNRNKSIIKSTGYIGVYFYATKKRKQWYAKVEVDGKTFTKFFYTEDEAIICKKQWNKEHGFHENHGRERTAE